MRSYGIMQGRLTPSKGRGIQFFPFDNWKQEFEIGASIGINEIEWIFDYDKHEENPLWTKEGIKEIKRLIETSSVKVHSVCFDYFMRRPFFKVEKQQKSILRSENLEFIHRVVNGMLETGASLLEIPLVDSSSVKTDKERKLVIDFFHDLMDIVKDTDVLIACETDMPAGVFRSFLDEIGHKRIRANYDSGNSSGLGYDHKEELYSLREYVANVHIKDRIFHGSTVALGTGDADFDNVFSSLRDIRYGGSFILQAARSKDGNEVDNIISQLDFVKGYCTKYGLV